MSDVTHVLDALAGYRLRWQILECVPAVHYPAVHYLRLKVSASTELALAESGQALHSHLFHILSVTARLEYWDVNVPARNAEQARAWITARLGPSHE